MIRQLAVALMGALVGAFLTLVSLTQFSSSAAVVPPRGVSQVTMPDLTVTISRDLFINEANRRVGPTLEQYDVRDPVWALNEDSTITLSGTSKIPVFDTDVGVSIFMQPLVRDGVLAVDILGIEYGRIRIAGGPLEGLADGVNEQLATAINRERFEVQNVLTSSDGIKLDLKVVGEL